ncbi:MAG: N-6 DNA methylase [Desulfosoma sp.]
MQQHVKSKSRVVNHGEVFTPRWVVNAMLDLVKQETERIDSRFLEPACGTGNFLEEILERKIRIVQKRYGKLQTDYERYAILAVSSIYGIDILEDNVHECRQRLFEIVNRRYTATFKKTAKEQFRKTTRFILKRNIVWGDALTMMHVGETPKHIVFSEWSLVNGGLIKRRDFTFHQLVQRGSNKEQALVSDLGTGVFIPTPIKEYPPVHFLEIADVQAE